MSSNQKPRPAGEQGQCDGRMPGSAGNALLDERVRAESAGVSAVDPDDGAGTLVQRHSDAKSSVESEVSQRGLVCFLGGDESAGAGTGPSGVSTDGPDDAMNEIEDLRSFPVWAEFVWKVRYAITGSPRHALAQHITSRHQPQRIDGVFVTLSSCGVDEEHQRDGMYECHIALKNVLEVGDGLALNYVSVGHKTFKQAQKAAFVEILSYILFRGPRYLRHHANHWDAFGFQVVLGEAESAVGFQGLRSRLGPRPRGQWSPLAAPFPP